MASLWIRSGCNMRVDPPLETCQVGVHIKALIKAILVAPSRILEIFFSFHVSKPRCAILRKFRSFLEATISREISRESHFFREISRFLGRPKVREIGNSTYKSPFAQNMTSEVRFDAKYQNFTSNVKF